MVFLKLTLVASMVASATAFAPSTFGARTSTNLSAGRTYKEKLKYVPVITQAQLPPKGSATSGVAGGLAICIAVSPTGQLFALGDKCPPVNQPLSFGKVTGTAICDPVLGTAFNLKTGQVEDWCPSGLGKLVGGLFEPSGVPVYPVKTNKGNVEVQVDVNYKLDFEANYWSGVLDAQGKANGKYY